MAVERRRATTDGSAYDSSKRANADRIICPALKALYMNGDLVVGPDGKVDYEESSEAIFRFGINNSLVITISHTGTTTLLDENDQFNIFELQNTVAEHPISTGVAELPTHDERAAAFLDLATFADADGRFYAKQVAQMVAYYRANPFNSNRKASAPCPCYSCSRWCRCAAVIPIWFFPGIGFLGTWAFLMAAMGRTDGKGCCGGLFRKYLTIEDARGLYLEGRYPAGWVMPPRGANLLETLVVFNHVLFNCLSRCLCCCPPKKQGAMMV